MRRGSEVLTEDVLREGMSINGGYSREQLEIFDVSWPPQKGWKKKIIGICFQKEILSEFVDKKDKHLRGGKK